jgi:rhodanese-related sulfurtransferase
MNEVLVNTIDVHELRKRRELDPNLCLIDVRELHEWHVMRIPGALHIPKDELAVSIKPKIPEYDREIYLHCKGGTRSRFAANCLVELGYKEVYSVDGGIAEWASFGYPVEK